MSHNSYYETQDVTMPTKVAIQKKYCIKLCIYIACQLVLALLLLLHYNRKIN